MARPRRCSADHPGAARLLAGAGEVTRFPAKAHFASWDGTAPAGASSGDQVRHRLPGPGTGRPAGCCTSWPPAGSATPPRAAPATTQTRRREDTPRSDARPQTPAAGIACHQMITDARRAATDPGGHPGAATGSSAAGLPPAPALRRSHSPDPPPTTLRQQDQPILLVTPGTLRRRRTADVIKRRLLDDGEDRAHYPGRE